MNTYKKQSLIISGIGRLYKQAAIHFLCVVYLCFHASGSVVFAQEFEQPLKINTTPGQEWADGIRAKGQGVPTIERSPGGRLWVAFRSEYSKPQMERSVMLVTSSDDGETWSGPKLVIHENGISASPFDPVLWHDPAGRLWLFWSQRPEFDVWAIRTDNSNKQNPVWSEPQRLMDGVMMNKPMVLSTGDWLFPASRWRESVHVFISRNQGLSIDHLGKADMSRNQIPMDIQYPEHMIIERDDERLWMLIRSRNPSGIAQTFSTNGEKWSDRNLYLKGPNTRFHIRRLSSGRLLLIYHDHAIDRVNLTAYLSEDDGASWKYRLLLDGRKTEGENNMPEQVSYPDAIEAEDGRIFVVYDRNRQTDQEILMAVFTEQDIISGAFVSEGSRSQVLVNNNRN